jgi:16S rRNA (adenine1518-N6/adenine1519-N6)-dimethyltransferase
MRARRRFAQHFLEPAWARKLLDAIALGPADVVLEIGAGRGALTKGLAAAASRVIAVEIDRDLATELSSTRPPNLELLERDVLHLDLVPLLADLRRQAAPEGRVRVVGNLPYNISSPILIRLMRAVRGGAPADDAVLMLQREVADRVAARPGTGDWGPLAVAVQLRADVTRLLSLPPGAFRPAPQVHSAVIRLAFHPPRVPVADEDRLDTVVRAMFGQRRKTLLNALRPYATTIGADAAGTLGSAGIDPRRRPETLDLAELARLAAALPAGPAADTG